ncbi:hypothetical protein PTKIN_Ptkin15bG0144200 [Pterospermum kingtungense]
MVENVGGCCCCGVLQTCCHRPDPENQIIQGVFEVHHCTWLSLSTTGTSIAIRLYSSQQLNPSTGKGVESEKAYLMQGKVLCREKLPILRGKIKLPTRVIKFRLNFEVVKGFGTPGAFVVENRDKHEFFLKSATLRYTVPAGSDEDKFEFYCNSWVYPLDKTQVKRVFFLNQLYLPKDTPDGLKKLRQKELEKLRGGSKNERQPWDRIYEYDSYNDLGDPDNGQEYARPVLGGSSEYPYPRRLRTGRRPCHQDPLSESRPAGCNEIYVPPDERLSHDKVKELRNNFVDALVRFLTPKPDHPHRSYQECPEFIKKIAHFFVPREALSTADFKMILSIVDFFRRKPKSSSPENNENVNSIEDVDDIFADKEVKELDGWIKRLLQKLVPYEIFNQVIATTTATKRKPVYSQLPSIIAEEKDAWLEETEFGRQLLAGTNPVRIRLLKEFSPLSEENWDLKSLHRIKEAMKKDEAFILEHHDYLLPFLSMINGKGVCAYASRTILLARSMLDTIEPVAIELSLPESSSSQVLFPDDDDDYNYNYLRWSLAKIHVAANDAAYHQLISHWLHTHAVIEPFIIATRRRLSVMHPIHRLLDPHFKDTLHINALARAIFLNAGGILERTLFTGEYSMQLSSHLYKQWRFDEQALPTDLVKRGMAVKAEESLRVENVSKIVDQEEMEPEEIEDEEVLERDEEEIEDENAVERDEDTITEKTLDEKVTYPGGVKLVLEDYPYAKDGTEIWDAIEQWVSDYCCFFYGKKDNAIKKDEEIQAWWSEIQNVGHGDQKKGWYDLTTREDLVRALTTLIWIASGLHAAVNSGQYAYAGWPPNRPMLLRKFVPEPRTEEMKEAAEDPDKFVCQMLPGKFQMAFVIAVMDLLSRHTSEEVYLGQRPPENKGEENGAVDKLFKNFRDRLVEIEGNIKERNKKYTLMNRWGYAKMPYKLLYPCTSKINAPSMEKGGMGIAAMGITNSISL